MPQDLTHRQLEAFRAVMTRGKVTLAAETLNTTQPTVSRLIADLEAVVGFALFERRGRSLWPTAEAHSLFEEVERSFVGLKEITRVVADIREYRRGNLLIAGMPALALQFLPQIIAEFCADQPGIRVSLRVHSSAEVLRNVSSQQFDLGFAAVEADHPSVLRRRFAIGGMQAVMAPDHPLQDTSRITPHDLHQQPFLALADELSTRRDTDVWFASGGLASGVAPDVVAEAQLSSALVEMAAQGLGVALVDPVTARLAQAQGRVVCRPLEPEVPFAYDLLQPALRQPSLVASRFLQLAEERLTQLLA